MNLEASVYDTYIRHIILSISKKKQKVTSSQVETALGDLQTTQTQQLDQVSQQTQQEVETVKSKYAGSISTSSSFGYIAGSKCLSIFFKKIFIKFNSIKL